ncbi:MAG: tRNA (adenosine(37)-N6)-dimethylallyltransferase MiaA, partial [Cyanobacteria bacterium P01_A01_bin.17]
PLLVGGTGLYIKAVVQGLQIPRVGPQLELRSQLPDQTQNYGWLQQVDPDSAAKIHPNDRVRTLRALEVYYVTGLPLSQQQGSCPPAYPILQIGLDDQDLEFHTHRIQQRTQTMIEQGWLTEVRNLMEQYGPKLPLLKTLGYREMQQHLQHDISLEEAQDLTVIHTRQFAKRQRTWFRADPTITWLAASNPDWLALAQVIDRFIRQLQL